VAFLSRKESIMKKFEFLAWLDTIVAYGDANYVDVEVDSIGCYHVMFTGITDKTPEEIADEEAIRVKEQTEIAIKACEDLLCEPYVTEGNGVAIDGALYDDTRDGLRLALRVLRGEEI
jgi:hypothetical protein